MPADHRGIVISSAPSPTFHILQVISSKAVSENLEKVNTANSCQTKRGGLWEETTGIYVIAVAFKEAYRIFSRIIVPNNIIRASGAKASSQSSSARTNLIRDDRSGC